MKLSKIQFLIGFILTAVISYGLWTMQANHLPEEIALLNTKYNLVEATPIIEEGENRSFASLIQTNSFQVITPSQNKETVDLIIKLDSSKDSLEDLVILKLQTDHDAEEISKEYANIQGIEYAEPDYTIEMAKAITFPSQKSPYIITTKNKTKNLEDEKKQIVIALIDSGVDTNHKDLKKYLLPGQNYFNDKKISDESGHGTHVAGILASNSENIKIMPIKFTDGQSAKLSNLIKSIKFATDNNAEVINLSLGLTAEPNSLKESISYANNKHVIIVAAAGNNNSDQKYFPAAWPNVIAVAALNNENEKTYISNYGNWIDFSALGQDVYSTAPGNRYKYLTGTSQATPIVSAKIANFLSSYNGDIEDLSNELYAYLKENSKKAQGKYSEELGKAL